jgi:hypothetical protein
LDTTLDCFGEIDFTPFATSVVAGQRGEYAASTAFVSPRDRERTVDPPAAQIRDDRSRWHRLDLASIKLIDPPPLDTALESVVLDPAPARIVFAGEPEENPDQRRRRQLRDAEDVDLCALRCAQRDSPHVPARTSEILPSILVQTVGRAAGRIWIV